MEMKENNENPINIQLPSHQNDCGKAKYHSLFKCYWKAPSQAQCIFTGGKYDADCSCSKYEKVLS